MPRVLRIVNYAVNGSGTGHLTRLLSIAKWLRRYAAYLGVRAEIYFLTSSEADGMLFHEGFASFKLPSKTSVGDAGIDKLTYLGLAKQWIWHSLALLRPHVLVVDTFPRGSFGELLSALDLCERRVFVHRPVKESFAQRADFQAMLPLYDLILQPEPLAEVALADNIRGKLRACGPIMLCERSELMSRSAAREYLGLGSDERVIYVSAGGGGDRGAEEQLHRTCREVLGDVSFRVVVGAGPLYRGRPFPPSEHGGRLLWLTQAIQPLLLAFDAAVCAAGYNTFYEMMYAGIPTVFLPQHKVADEQHVRAERASQVGAGIVAEPGKVLDAIRSLTEPAKWRLASDAAQGLVPENRAREAAAEILRLLLPSGDVDAAEEALTADVLRHLRGPLTQEQVFDVLRTISDGNTSPGKVAALSVKLIDLLLSLSVPPILLPRLIKLLCNKIPSDPSEARFRMVEAIAKEFAPFSDWPGALSFVRLLGVEKQRTGEALSADLINFLGRLKAEGADLYRGIQRISMAQAGATENMNNREALS